MKDSWPYNFVDPMEIRLVYSKLIADPQTSPTQAPNRDQKNAADAILRVGR